MNPASGLDMETDVCPSLMSGRDAAGVSRPAAGTNSRNVAPLPAPPEPSETYRESLHGPAPPLSVRLPSSTLLSIRPPPAGPPFEKNCVGLD